MLLVATPSRVVQSSVLNVLDAPMRADTEFGPNPEENLLGVATVVLADLQQAGFTSGEIEVVARHVQRLAEGVSGGRN